MPRSRQPPSSALHTRHEDLHVTVPRALLFLLPISARSSAMPSCQCSIALAQHRAAIDHSADGFRFPSLAAGSVSMSRTDWKKTVCKYPFPPWKAEPNGNPASYPPAVFAAMIVSIRSVDNIIIFRKLPDSRLYYTPAWSIEPMWPLHRG